MRTWLWDAFEPLLIATLIFAGVGTACAFAWLLCVLPPALDAAPNVLIMLR